MRLAPMVGQYNREHDDRCVVPFFLQLDNSYGDTRAPKDPRRPFESEAPIRTYGAVRNAREARDRQAAELTLNQPSLGAVDAFFHSAPKTTVRRYAHLRPVSHPGTTAPLGWTLSGPSMASLDKQLSQSNKTDLTRVRQWLSDDLRCQKSSRPRRPNQPEPPNGKLPDTP